MCPTRSTNQHGTVGSSRTNERSVMSQHALALSADGLQEDNVVPDVFSRRAQNYTPTNAAQVCNMKSASHAVSIGVLKAALHFWSGSILPAQLCRVATPSSPVVEAARSTIAVTASGCRHDGQQPTDPGQTMPVSSWYPTHSSSLPRATYVLQLSTTHPKCRCDTQSRLAKALASCRTG